MEVIAMRPLCDILVPLLSAAVGELGSQPGDRQQGLALFMLMEGCGSGSSTALCGPSGSSRGTRIGPVQCGAFRHALQEACF